MNSTKSEVTTIRPLAGTDVETLAAWFQDFDDIAIFDRQAPVPVSPETLRKMWADDIETSVPRQSFWFVGESADGNPLGICGLQSINYIHGDAVLPLFVAKPYRSLGVGFALSIRMIDLAFDTLRLRRVSTNFRRDNNGTRKIVEKLGFAEEGRLREAWHHDGRHEDVILAGLLREEWMERRKEQPDIRQCRESGLTASTLTA